jgi:molecular chaperone HtpG
MNNIKLYVKRVLITENCKEICPEWLSFIVGIIETEDIPLNISREMLQYDNNIKILRKIFIKKCIDLFKDIKSNDNTLYINFYNKYGRFIKLGVHDEIDETSKNKLKQLLIFKSLKTEDKYIILDEYIETLTDIEKEKKIIYYIIGDNYDNILKSPYIEKFIYKNYNVLFMNEPADEYMMENFKEYNDYKFVCISNGVIYLNDTDKEIEEYKIKEEEYKELCDYIKKKYNDVFLCSKISLYLISPCIIYGAEYGFSAHKEKIIKAQTLLTVNKEMNTLMYHKNIEINPNNNAIIKLKNLFDNKEYEKCDIIINLICNTALLHSGYIINNNEEYIKNIYKLITDGLDLLIKS